VPKKPKTNQAEVQNEAQGRDLFQTPSYATELLIPFISKDINVIWEPACGDGKIVQRLTENKYSVFPSDIRHSDGWIDNTVYNFIAGDETGTIPYPIWVSFQTQKVAIVTNPPFSLKRRFYEKCLEYKVPFALLIPADYSGWIIKAIQNGAEKIIPTRRIDYITPTGLSGATGHTSYYHSMWLTWGFNLGKTETFVELTNEMKENI